MITRVIRQSQKLLVTTYECFTGVLSTPKAPLGVLSIHGAFKPEPSKSVETTLTILKKMSRSPAEAGLQIVDKARG